MKKFQVKDYSFGALAQLYYPKRDYDSALRMFRHELRVTSELWTALVKQGYMEKSKFLTRAQVSVIVRYLGEP